MRSLTCNQVVFPAAGSPGGPWAMRPAMDLTQRIKTRARQLGFDLAGVTNPAPSDHSDFYTRWLEAGHHGNMAYMARPDAIAKRRHPTRILDSARSILVVGMNYYAHADPPIESLQGRVSRYASGTDYHTVLRSRLLTLAAWIEDAVGRPLARRAYVDTGPVLERELAQRAGLGWIGKNTCLIHPRIGSFLFLGVLFLELELKPDPPFARDHCGNCNACIEACPTAALIAPRTLDARRCISYLSVECRGSIPLELRSAMGTSVFGCDICQTVCPWTQRFAGPSREPAFYPRAGQRAPNLLAWLKLDEASFRASFRDTAIWRARRAGLARNAAVVLGNWRDPDAIPALTQALSDPDHLVVEHVTWALEQLAASV